MFRLAQPQYLWLLLLIPLLLLLFALGNSRNRALLKRFGNMQLLWRLMPDYSKYRGWVKMSIICLCIALISYGLARPQTGAKAKEVKRKGIEVIIALDVSNSMLAEDFTPNRLERAKMAISRLVDRMRDNRIGLIVFAGDAYVQLPVTADFVSAKVFLSSINTNIVPRQGTAIGSAITTALSSFSQEGNRGRVLVIISDGENHEDDAIAAAKQAADMGVNVYTIGIGSPQGVPIPTANGMLKDKNGDVVITKLNEGMLAEIAKAGNGFYARASNTDVGLAKLLDEVEGMDKEEFSALVFQEYNEWFMYFFVAAALLLLLEPLLLERKNKLLNSIDIFQVKNKSKDV
ncbi:MAG: VWA domain-containing protein [Prevotellaceae bacterium]|jgi:Ca-activated chloride channel family protein|nr:VWA domain-containing protein [Prevotellaceae bacterium]